MYSIKRTDAFDAWLFGLKDGMTHRRLLARLCKASLGNLGDVKPWVQACSRCASTSAPAGAWTTSSAPAC